MNKQKFHKIKSKPWCLFSNQIKKFFGKIFIIIIIDFELFNCVSTIISL